MNDTEWDAEWDRIVEHTKLELEVNVLHAEAIVERHAAEDMETRFYTTLLPESRLARLEAECKAFVQTEPYTPLGNDDPDYAPYCIELACYGWRRDYGEWPTYANLTDRVAVDRRLSHREAGRRIVRAINDPSDSSHLYAIRQARLTEILEDVPSTLGPWRWLPLGELRFYVSAEGMSGLMASHYQNRCWRHEAAA